MFDLDLRRKRRALEAAEARYDQIQAEAGGEALSEADVTERLTDHWSQVVLAREAYQQARSQGIIRQARRLEIPIPEINDTDGVWEYGTTFAGRFLSDLGTSRLRAQIRVEQRERYESWSRWIALTIGLIGAATGLVAVISTLF